MSERGLPDAVSPLSRGATASAAMEDQPLVLATPGMAELGSRILRPCSLIPNSGSEAQLLLSV